MKNTKPSIDPVARRMGQFMAEVTTSRGSCTEDDLKRSYSPAQIHRHADAARAVAAEMMTARDLAA